MSDILHLENEINRLKEREKQLLNDAKIYRQLFEHLVKEVEELKKEILRK